MISKTESGRVSKEIPGSGSGSGTRWALFPWKMQQKEQIKITKQVPNKTKQTKWDKFGLDMPRVTKSRQKKPKWPAIPIRCQKLSMLPPKNLKLIESGPVNTSNVVSGLSQILFSGCSRILRGRCLQRASLCWNKSLIWLSFFFCLLPMVFAYWWTPDLGHLTSACRR